MDHRFTEDLEFKTGSLGSSESHLVWNCNCGWSYSKYAPYGANYSEREIISREYHRHLFNELLKLAGIWHGER